MMNSRVFTDTSRSAHVPILILALMVAGSVPAPAEEVPPRDRLQDECDYGVTLALGGETVRAESVFVSLLSHAPGDPRALNNLGNVSLLRGRSDVAVSFYERAAEVDSADPGIVLNVGTALLLLGEEEAAVEAASEGLQMAGGPGPAANLLGLTYGGDTPDWPKGEKRTFISKDEVLSLLNVAAGKVPADSTRTQSTTNATGGAKGKRRVPLWRSAGPRASDADETAAVVYWKR